MKRAISVLFALAASLFMTGSPSAGPLDVYQWEARPLLVFGPNLGDKTLVRQTALLKDAREGLRERDMALLVVAGDDGEAFVRFGPPELKYVPPERGASDETLRETYSVPLDAFTVILVGKDGGEKGRWTSVVEPRTIFDMIDGMPMRQREMRDGG